MADIGVSIEWNGDQFMELLRREMMKRLAVAGEAIRAAAVKSLRRTKHPPASMPGAVPAWRTGYLFRSVFSDPSPANLAVRVGTPVKYGLYLELGTSKMAARPWLRPALLSASKSIVAIMTKPLPNK
jgi:hypothetical protein